MSSTVARLDAALENLGVALAAIGVKIGDEFDPDFVKAAAAFDELVDLKSDLERETKP